MIKKYSFVLLLVGSLLSAEAQTFSGNGGTGFGGVLGGSTLTVTENSGVFTFSLQTGSTFSGNNIVFYFDTQPGVGFADTSTFSDNADPGRTAISGFQDPGRTVATFASGFTADFAVSLEPTFAGLFNLESGGDGSHVFVANTNLTGSGTNFSFTVNAMDIGIVPGQTFNMVATLISSTAYRSNETIGSSTTVPGTSGDAPNAGFSGTTTFNESLTVIPEPSTVSLLAASAIFSAGFYIRRRNR